MKVGIGPNTNSIKPRISALKIEQKIDT